MKRILCVVVLVVSGAFLYGCVDQGDTDVASSEATAGVNKKGEPKKKENRPKPVVPVKVAVLESGEISSSLVFDSVLETESSVEIFSESSGLILDVLVEEGDRVKKGQVLARLESQTQQVDADENKARYENEKLAFKRSSDLAERRLINQQEIESAAFKLEQARLRYERSRINLENTIVRATVDGVLTERVAQVGRRVTANKKLFAMMNLDALYANVNVPGQYLLEIETGLPAMIESDLIDGVSYEAYVKLISPIVDSNSGTFKVKVAVKKDNGMPIYPGMFVSVQVIVDTHKEAILVPKDAIVHEGDLKYVYRVRDHHAKKIQLHEGYSNTGMIESLSGLEVGDSIIVLGHNALKDGSEVKVVTESIVAEDSVPEKSVTPAES